MPHTFYKIWIHILWATKEHKKVLPRDICKQVELHIKEKCIEEGYHLETIAVESDHTHCLISLNPKFPISEVVNKLKGESSNWINSRKFTASHFAWQVGYAVFSVSESQIEKVKNYIMNQDQHHKIITFAEELEKFLKLHKVERLKDRIEKTTETP